jgi:hypothetical protein
MSSDLSLDALQIIGSAGTKGIAMGKLVERLRTDGHDLEQAELAVWNLLQDGRCCATGFVRRVVRRHDRARGVLENLTYEFVLSADFDSQESP